MARKFEALGYLITTNNIIGAAYDTDIPKWTFSTPYKYMNLKFYTVHRRQLSVLMSAHHSKNDIEKPVGAILTVLLPRFRTRQLR